MDNLTDAKKIEEKYKLFKTGDIKADAYANPSRTGEMMLRRMD